MFWVSELSYSFFQLCLSPPDLLSKGFSASLSRSGKCHQFRVGTRVPEGTKAFLMTCTLVRVSIAMIKHHDQKQLAEKRVYFILQLSGHSPSLRTVRVGTYDTKLKGGTGTEVIEECCLLACPLWLTQFVFLCIRTTFPGITLPSVGWSHSPQSLIKKIPHRLAYSST